MTVAAQLAALYAAFGEPVTLAGQSRTAVYEGGWSDDGTVGSTQPTLRVRVADAAALPIGAAIVCRGSTYALRSKEPMPPDEVEVRLVLGAA